MVMICTCALSHIIHLYISTLLYYFYYYYYILLGESILPGHFLFLLNLIQNTTGYAIKDRNISAETIVGHPLILRFYSMQKKTPVSTSALLCYLYHVM